MADPAPTIEKEMFSIPGFVNPTATNCYANSSLQYLLNFRSINRAIMTLPDSALNRLTAAYNDIKIKTLDATEVITSLGFPIGEQQDATDFIGKIVYTDGYQAVSDQLNFTYRKKIVCDSCDLYRSKVNINM